MDLTSFGGLALSAEVLWAVTEAVMDAVTTELEVLRGAAAPAQRYDPRGRVPADGDGRRTA